MVVFSIGLFGVVFPAMYFYYGSRLPPLQTEFDLERLLRGYIEGERMSIRAGSADDERRRPEWPRPDIQALPHDLVVLYISEFGCPGFFRTPRESSFAASWRALNHYLIDRELPGEDGKCELRLASHLADAIRIRVAQPRAIASSRIRGFLTKDKLVAYDLSSVQVSEGLFGVEDTALDLFKKPASALSLAQLAELMLALPPYAEYEDVKLCKAPLLLKASRDQMLTRLAEARLVPEDRARRATLERLACD